MRTYDPATRATTVLLDDGRRVEVAGEAVSPRLRLLRPGQRVRLRREDGRVVALTHPALPGWAVPATGPGVRCPPRGSTMSP